MKCTKRPMPNGDMSPSAPPEEAPEEVPVLSTRERLAYSVGHVLNDLCASMWFTYMLVFFHFVNRFGNKLSGVLILVGQVADALSTPLVGYLSDNSTQFIGYGRRKSWHLLGSVCVFVTFPFLFMPCLGGGEHAHQWAQAFYYSMFIIIFQFGWASTQISHLSLNSDLTPISSERCGLNAYRNTAAVCSNFVVYVTTWAVLGSNSESHLNIRPEDAGSFKTIMLIILGLGTICTILFHIFVKEPQHPSMVTQPSTNTIVQQLPEQTHVHLTPRQWMKNSQFYKVALLYMCTRLFCNVTQVYVPLYLTETLGLTATSIAFIPLTSYSCGMGASIVIKFISTRLNKGLCYLVGAIFGLLFCAWVYLGPILTPLHTYVDYQIYGVAALLGLSANLVLVMSLSITNDLIGKNTKSGAFVFGAMSFTDKLSNGIVIIIIQALAPNSSSSCDNCMYYHEYALVIAGGVSMLLALVALAMLSSDKIGDFSGDDNCPQDLPPSETTPLLGGSGDHTAKTCSQIST